MPANIASSQRNEVLELQDQVQLLKRELVEVQKVDDQELERLWQMAGKFHRLERSNICNQSSNIHQNVVFAKCTMS